MRPSEGLGFFVSRHIRLAIRGASPCGDCFAACCRKSVSEYAILLQGEDERRRFGPWTVTLPVADAAGEVRHEAVIPYRDEVCPFLDGDTDLCTIYDDRPRSCREFECTRHFDPRRGHGYFLRGNPRVVALLQR